MNVQTFPLCSPPTKGHQWTDPTPEGMQRCQRCNIWRPVTEPDLPPENLFDMSKRP